ncbi:winged helix-turn-helix domain-containing protein [Haladaptatus sp. AB643]|uniref:ArsR/SmtB family transcription factor n=1 Tax=Haladaptatus sp. AB643 TaxID=2934174 RepID=UPI00209BE3E1|nr:winged helix-turn-helix domain-containing protein [Haladaptatus sp. AB643]MCO8242862.1 helix-turn-helix domain-containing protein [Haladaptatus sp. AB643]
MADLLPSSSDVEPPSGGSPRVLGVDSDDADDLLGALSSDTARGLLSALHDQPATASELSEQVDTSLQNAQYHLKKLEDADLITAVDTIYSEKGREMKVYAPSEGPLILFAGREEQTTGLKDALSRVLGVAVLLGLVSAGIQYTVTEGLLGIGGKAAEKTASGGGGQVGTFSTESTNSAGHAANGVLATIPPGVLFFAGGALVLVLGAVGWYFVRNR